MTQQNYTLAEKQEMRDVLEGFLEADKEKLDAYRERLALLESLPVKEYTPTSPTLQLESSDSYVATIRKLKIADLKSQIAEISQKISGMERHRKQIEEEIANDQTQ